MNRITIRGYKHSDKGFVFESWMKGFRYSNKWYELISDDVFKESFQKHFDDILQSANTTIACLAEDSDVILGYCVYEDEVLHWIFVKDSWRRMGIAKLLAGPNNIKSSTGITRVGRFLIKKYGLEYNPYQKRSM